MKLFLRSSKGVTLTDEGQVLYNHIEKAFSNISQGEDEIRHIHELGIGQKSVEFGNGDELRAGHAVFLKTVRWN